MTERYECKMAPAIFIKDLSEHKIANIRILANRLSWDKKTRWIADQISRILDADEIFV